MRVGIVGSRKRNTLKDRRIILDIVSRFPKETVIVSGGARGPDSFAEEAARICSLGTLIFRVPPAKDKNDFREKAYARNTEIAENSDILYALVIPERKGGTEDTIKKALLFKKKVCIVDEEGRISYLSPEMET